MRVRTTTVITTDGRNGAPGLLSATVEELPDDGDGGATREDLYPGVTTIPNHWEARVREVVEENEHLALDDEGDRELLIERLVNALEG